MKRNHLLILSFIFAIIYTIIAILFLNPLNNSENRIPIHEYIGLLIGTFTSIVSLIILYKTLNNQNKQNIETLFFNLLNTFNKEKEEVKALIIAKDQYMHENIHKNLKLEGLAEINLKKNEYLNFLEDFFITPYSRNSKTPRINEKLNKYFKTIEVFSNLIYKSNLKKDESERLRDIFFTVLSDEEIKFICYYFYLFYEIINSKDKTFKCKNDVKQFGLLSNSLQLSDDFLHNFDPRMSHYDLQLTELKKKYSKKRN